METASKDILFTVAMNLELPSLLKWCASNSRINKNVCQNEHLWRSKLLQDYPDYQKFELSRSLRETYVFLYQLSYIKKLLNTNKSLCEIFLRKQIDLSNKRLKKVPAFDLPNLEELNLSYNQLTEVPVFHMPNLQMLNLENNKLIKVPEFDYPELQRLYLSYNKLTEIPSFQLPNLGILSLYRNQLKTLPVFHMPELS